MNKQDLTTTAALLLATKGIHEEHPYHQLMLDFYAEGFAHALHLVVEQMGAYREMSQEHLESNFGDFL